METANFTLLCENITAEFFSFALLRGAAHDIVWLQRRQKARLPRGASLESVETYSYILFDGDVQLASDSR